MVDKKKRKTLNEQFEDRLTWFKKKMVALNKERVYEAAIDEDASADVVNEGYLVAKKALETVGNYVFDIGQDDRPPDPPVKVKSDE